MNGKEKELSKRLYKALSDTGLRQNLKVNWYDEIAVNPQNTNGYFIIEMGNLFVVL